MLQAPQGGLMPIVPAAIAAVTSIIVTLVTLWLQPRRQKELDRFRADLQTASDNERDVLQKRLDEFRANLQSAGDEQRNVLQSKIEELKAQLDERKSVSAARRAYEYEARKRLYEEVEPVRFRVYEALEEAHYRVRSLVRTSRSGNLGTGRQSWIDGNSYYLRSTIFKILGPVVHFRLLQQRMTFTDFHLDREIALQYLLLKLYVRSFTDDFDFAAIAPKLEYKPNHPRTQEDIDKHPDVYCRQALVLGDLECVADILITHEGDKTRALQFSELEKILMKDELDDNLEEVVKLFASFSPQRKPVLARLLIAQAFFAQLILSTYRSPADPSQLPARLETLLSDPQVFGGLTWSEDTTQADIAMVRSYLMPRLGQLDNTFLALPQAKQTETLTAQP